MRNYKQPFVTAEQLDALCREYPTPFHLYDERGIVENARRVNAAFAWNAGYREYFAVKATPTPAIMQLLRAEGCGMDCSSLTELMLCEKLGITGESIMFSSNDTPAEEFRLAHRLGAIINFDDISHIPFYDECVGEYPETMCCRYNPGGKFAIANRIMDNPGEAKYGMTREQITEAFRMLTRRGVKHIGIHAFLASNTTSEAYYPELSAQLFCLAVELHRETGAHVAFINLSGGVGIPYRPGEPMPDIAAIGEGVRRRFEDILVPAGMGDVKIYTEMGRFMLAPYGCLVTKVLHMKHIYKDYVGVDASACDLMRPAMYGAYHHITVLGKENALHDHTYDVTGGLCENNDKFAIDRNLPEIEIGDYVYIHDTGAHGYSMGYNYNAKLRSAELLLREDGSVEMIRRAETPKDYFATFDFTGLFDDIQ